MANTLENYNHDNITDFNTAYKNNISNKTLKIVQWNVRGMNNLAKFDEIALFLESCESEIDVLIIGETWLKPENCQLYVIPNYSSYFSCRNASNGGLAVYIKENINHRIISNTHNDGFHHIFAELTVNEQIFDLHGVYRPPNYNFNDFLTILENIIASTSSNHSCFIFGDINVPMNNNNNNVVIKYKSLLESYSIICTNTFPTRPATFNILDHVLCSIEETSRLRNDTIYSNVSDHNQIVSTIKLRSANENVVLKKKIVNNSKLNRDFKNFIDNLRNLDDPEYTMNLILTTYNVLLEKYTKTISKKVKLKNSHCPWMNLDLWTIIKIKNNYLKHAKQRPNDQHIKDMLSYVSKKYEKIKYASKKSYFDSLLSNTTHSKLWSHMKSIFGQSKKNDKIMLVQNGVLVNNTSDVCNIFNNFFSTIGQNLANQIPPTSLSPLSNASSVSETIFLRPATANEILVLINELKNKKSCGPDNISVRILKNNADSFSKVLSAIFNRILETGLYPDCLKIAKVIPIFKAGDACDCNNYRPISTLSVFNKILEKMLISRLLSFINEHNVLYTFQYGFRHGCSTLIAITELVDFISGEIESKHIVGSLFLDLKKAFDTLNHSILLKKLDHYGIRGVANDIIKSYLSNRKQFVTLDSQNSSTVPIQIGVPQGSNLGPLLFLLYINDLGKLPLKGKARLFADDTALFYPGTNISSVINDIESDLIVLVRYFNENLLSLNVQKTKYMIFHSCRTSLPVHRNPVIINETIEKVEKFKYLGIYLDSVLSWASHIKHMEHQIACLCGVMWRVKKFVPKHALLKFYYAFIHSRLNYLVSIWGQACVSYLVKIQRLQNRSLKIVFNKPLLFPTLLLYSDISHNILPLKSLCDLQIMLLVHDVLYNRKIHHNLQLSTATHSYELRNSNNLQRELMTTNLGQKRFSFIGPTLVNQLPLEIKSIANRHSFKRRLQKRLKPSTT